jgi:transposase
MALTNLEIKRAQPKEKAYSLSDGLGLALLIEPNGTKGWRFRYRFDNKARLMSFGSYPLITLSEAREARDKNHARRLTAMLMLHRGERVSDVARTLCCARSSVGHWINWFTLSGVEGLKSLPAGRARRWPFEPICTLLRELVKHAPGDFGYQRSRWSTELLAIKINEITGCQLHAVTVRRWLPSAGLMWRRAAPTLRIRDPHKDEKMAAIHKALDECSAEHPVFYEDEVDIHLNPKIGTNWQVRGQQKRVVTPGQNEKYYLAGALHSGTGKVSYVGGNSKSSALFISLLKRLKATYRRAKR